MKYCANCGTKIEDNAKFCYCCGNAAQTVVSNNMNAVVTPAAKSQVEYTDEEQEFLKNTDLFLNLERVMWLVNGILFAIISGLFLLAAMGAYYEEDIFDLITFNMFFFLPFMIISFIAAGKVPKYRETLNTDLKPAAERMDSVALLVFSVIFNETAAVFFIINFVRGKTNAKLIEGIIAKQSSAGKF